MTQPTPAPPPPDPPRTPMAERVTGLEDRLTELIARYQAFVNVIVKELDL